MHFDALPPMELHFQLQRMNTAYAHCIDDDRLEAWPDFFAENCTYKVAARENVERGLPLATIDCDSRAMLIDRVVSLRHANVYEAHHYRHVTGLPLVMNVTRRSVRAHTSYAVFRTRGNGKTDVYSAGVYDDVIVDTADGLKFQQRHVIYDTDQIDTLLVIPL
jgi:anthranilate 1,2-dioxygenase small subunit